ncbi:YrrS family protein [Alkalihalobacillus hemicellulosilyticus]|uniref:DUF1510 domain-containing protein n=1 Tax=Halalkalibacter hemicellulosilyticusJCM 9152 TaxID=1236971 RepID=W4QJX5_9BACI|nr:YrrS family protein [Halalkalibacter hemicellulosilyticus]GAE32222.1 hypothetical protein JCM9152_3746 [Halalkalibacter hemicellulosilyticusJCM 9152]
MRSYRYEERRKKRINIIYNIAIVIVMVLIAFFALQIFNQDDSELVNESETTEDEENEQDDQDPTVPDPALPDEQEEPPVQDPVVPEDSQPDNDGIFDDEEGIEVDVDEGSSRPSADEWEPIGTTQSELRLEFGEGTTNRQEMDRALSYASGLSLEEMTVWRIENAGDQRSVRGVVSNYENSETPYEIFLEWQDGEGWLPVQLNQLDHNPYTRN